MVDEVLLAQALSRAGAESLDTTLVLGVAGNGLSGGQSQRVAIARAYYRALVDNTPVIILDEPTSALDAATEHSVIAGARKFAAEGKTVIIVSHRRAVIAAADAVLELTPPSASASSSASSSHLIAGPVAGLVAGPVADSVSDSEVRA
jgi:ATP-binding cassette subfamily C protein CydD